MAIYKLRNLNTGQATPIPAGEYSVGREDDSYLRVTDGSVSRRHAKLLNLNDELFVEDSGSANGTAAQGSYISSRVRITYGDVVHFGSVPFRVDPEVKGEAAQPLAAVVRTASSTPSEISRSATMQITPAQRADSSHILPKMVAAPPVDATPKVEVASAPLEPAVATPVVESSPVITEEPTPEPVAVQDQVRPLTVPMPKRPPVVRAGGTPLHAAASPHPPVVANPPVTADPLKEALPPRPAGPPSTPAAPPSVVPTHAKKEKAEAKISMPTAKPVAQASASELQPGTHWIWWLVVFLAGLGVGILIGLIYAQIFFHMGAKP